MNSGDAIPNMICKNFGYCSSSPSGRERIEVRVGNSASDRKIENKQNIWILEGTLTLPSPFVKGRGSLKQFQKSN